jgi:NADPH2:quinone reductase
MKAYALTTAGQPAALLDIPDPQAPADGLLVRVRVASVNGIDVFQAGGHLAAMMPHEFPSIVGRDYAGVVEAVGEAQTAYAVGDEVFGFIPPWPVMQGGTFTELVPVGSEMPLALKPAAVSFETAATLPLAAVTALDAVDATDVATGDVVLVVGATGGVGSIALQLATLRGATVIATAKAGGEEAFVRSLGASETVDYSTGEVATAVAAQHPTGIDILLDFVDREDAFTDMASLVRDGGRIATSMGAADVEAYAGRDVRATNVMGSPTDAKLADLAEQVAAGTLKVEIQRTFPLDEAAGAIAAFAGGTRGKVVVQVG